MTALSVLPPFDTFKDVDGDPLEAGSVYIGLPGQSAEFFPKPAFWDKALTTPVSQPAKTKGGFAMNGSTPGRIYTDGDHSITVKDVQDQVVQQSLNQSRVFDVGYSYANRSAFVSDAPGLSPSPGQIASDGAVEYVYSPGATAIADLPGWLPLSGTTRTDITVNIPTNFATIQDAIDGYSGVLCAPGSNIIINIESGQEITFGVSVRDGDYSRFVVTSEDSVVNLASAFSGNIFFGERAALPTLDCLIDGAYAASVGHGYYMRLGSSGLIKPNAGIRNLPSTGAAGSETSGVFLTGSSQVTADESVITGNPRNVWVSETSRFDAQNADFSGATSDHLLYASRRSQVHIAFCDLSGAAENALVLRRSGAVAEACNFDNAGATAIVVERTSQLSAHSRSLTRVTVNNAGTDAIVVQDGSQITISGADIDSAVRDTIRVESASSAAINDVQAVGNGSTSRYGVNIRSGCSGSIVDSSFTAHINDIQLNSGGFASFSNTTTDAGVQNFVSIGEANVADVNEVSVRGVFSDGAFSTTTHTGDTATTELASATVPVGTITEGRQVLVRASGSLSGGSGGLTLSVKFTAGASNNSFSLTQFPTASGVWVAEFVMDVRVGNLNSQRCFGTGFLESSAASGKLSTTLNITENDLEAAISGKLVNSADTVTINSLSVRVI